MTGATPEWERVQDLFHRVVDLPEPERRDILAAVEDRTLVETVLAMCAEDRAASSLDGSVSRLAEGVLGGPIPRALAEQGFGPYRLERLLGEGGMGAVYLARRSDLDSVAAIKILRDASLSPSRRERFAAEQRTLAQLSHPAIAQLYDADTLPDGTPWFAMEYVEGVPLTEYCRTRRSSLRARLLLLRAVAEAIQHAHDQAVIHRDLKPSNILVKSDGTVKLLDFGIARQLEDLERERDRTRTGLRMMTPAYAAPEQIRGDRTGIQTDVYSLGVTLYELLAGRLPFDLEDRSPAETLAIVAEADLPRPSQRAVRDDGGAGARGVTRDAWGDLDVLCLTAMHRDPARRYRTAEALIRDIDHFLDGQPLDARPDALSYRLGKFVRRNRRVVTTSAIGAAVVVGLVAFYTVRLARARTEALDEAARTERIQRFMLDLFQGGDEEAGAADSLRVMTLIDRGADQAAGLSREPAVQAELYQTLGGIYQELGRMSRADSLLTLALERRRQLFGPDHPETARSLVALGLLRANQAALDSAERLARAGLEMTRRHRPADHPDVIAAVTALARVFEEQGKYDEAIALLDQIAAVQASGPPSSEVAATLYGLASNHFYAGHYPVADSLSRRVLAMTRELYGARHPNVALNLSNLGAVQQDLGRYLEAERYHREALEIVTGWYGEDHPRTAAALTLLGRALVFENSFDDATGLLERALAIRERAYGPRHPSVASTLNELGSIAYQTDRYDAALAYWGRVLSIYREVHKGEKHYTIGVALSNLASVYTAQRDYRRGEGLYRQALDIFLASLGPNHINVGIGRIKLGRALLRQSRFREATAETQAGYDILVKQADPAVSFLKAARTDLMIGYDSLGRRDLAARYRAELAAAAK